MTTTANFADNFVAPIDYGADGPGTVSYALALSGNNVASGSTQSTRATRARATATATARVRRSCSTRAATPSPVPRAGWIIFTISIDPNTGVVTFTQLDNIWHPSTASDDDTATLMANIGSVYVQQIVTDSDGDFDTASVDVSQGVFQIEDDGPVPTNDVDNIAGGGTTAVGKCHHWRRHCRWCGQCR
jgi:hypothetical protein